MDLLKRNLAPITENAWEEIDSRAAEVFRTQLSARRSVHVDGPHGLDYNAISEGRLGIIKGEQDEVRSSRYKVTPLVEARYTFELDRWELDNLERGTKDVDLGPLENAVEKMAKFEDEAIYNGFKGGEIKGLTEQAKKSISFGEDEGSIVNAVSEGMLLLQESYADKPYDLILGKEAYSRVQKQAHGYPLNRRIEEIIGGQIIFSEEIKGALLIPHNHEDLELTIGQDFSIGYEEHDDKKVRLFISESFMFRTLDPEIIVKYTI
ncbi:MAG: family 1 encapsulin nanocompartment shell protein [Halanaerobiales bacterium]|nr:family 1 encapsulin nanocompartment shell protein [Halanaerobiales bacterium]